MQLNLALLADKIHKGSSKQDIKQLDFSNSQLTGLEESTFTNMVGLLDLNLSDNQITAINDKCFSAIKQLEKLDLSGNKIESLMDIIIKSLTKLKVV